MGRYLEEIEKSEIRGAGNHQNLHNPIMDSFVGFVGSSTATFEKDIPRKRVQENPNEATANHAELTWLVRLCGEAYSFTEAEHAEALGVANNDPDNALLCFRVIAGKRGLYEAPLKQPGGVRRGE
jgi:hypothetical protein